MKKIELPIVDNGFCKNVNFAVTRCSGEAPLFPLKTKKKKNNRFHRNFQYLYNKIKITIPLFLYG